MPLVLEDVRLIRGLAKQIAPPERLLPSEWAERFRSMSRRQSRRYGKWRNASAPFLVGIMDLPFVFRQIRRMNLKKAGQIGGSEAMRNVLGWAASEEPDPALLCLPDKETGQEIFGSRVLPLFDDTQRLKELQTEASRDMKLSKVTLGNGFDLRLAWSGSAASMASHPVRFVFLDEIDKMKKWVGVEASPLKLADIRTATYENSLLMTISTPTTRLGQIHELEERSPIRLRFFVPCPHCGTNQQLIFGNGSGAGVRWEYPKELTENQDRAAYVEANLSAWYECESCKQKIHDLHKPRIVGQGFWGTVDKNLKFDGRFKYFCDGRVEGKLPQGTEVGIQISCLYSLAPKHTFAGIAAEFIKCKGDAPGLMNFYNSWLGEVFESQTAAAKTSDLFRDKCAKASAPPKVVPKWASRLLMGVDTQKDGFYFVVRAFGHGFRSRRVHHGQAQTFEELRRIAFESQYPYEDSTYAPISCYMVGIDSGGGTKYTNDQGVDSNRTDEVYRWALSDPARIKALKGESDPQGMPIRTRPVTYSPPDRARSPYRVFLHLIDTGYHQDILDSRIGGKMQEFDASTGEELGEVDLWELNSLNDDDYNRQLGSMHKIVVDPKSRVERWTTKTSGAANHYRDVEVYLTALAQGPGMCSGLPTPEVFQQQMRSHRESSSLVSGGTRMPDGRKFLASRR